MKVDLKDLGYLLALIFVLGLFIVIFGRPLSEGFDNPSDAIRCGVSKPCPGHLKCINGFCANTEPARKYENQPNEVPLLPDGQALPFF
jgi:hypothetical protein